MQHSRWLPIRRWTWTAWLGFVIVLEASVLGNSYATPAWGTYHSTGEHGWPWAWQTTSQSESRFYMADGTTVTKIRYTRFVHLRNAIPNGCVALILALATGTLLSSATETFRLSRGHLAAAVVLISLIATNALGRSPHGPRDAWTAQTIQIAIPDEGGDRARVYGVPTPFCQWEKSVYRPGFPGPAMMSSLNLLLNGVFALIVVLSVEHMFVVADGPDPRFRFSIKALLILTACCAVVLAAWRTDSLALRLLIHLPVVFGVICLLATALESVWAFRASEA